MPKVTAQRTDMVGVYKKSSAGVSWHQSGTHGIIVATRPPTPKKPPSYLLTVTHTGARTYMSSLYPTDLPGVWRAEYGGTWYIVSQDASGNIELTPAEPGPNGNPVVYHRDLVSKNETEEVRS